jgi:uncharacterized protein (DUF983 family)
MKDLTLDKNSRNNNDTTVPSEFKAALHAKCPECRTGNMFANNMYSLSGQKMNERCPHCGFYFEVEPGYFYVAMFVSYALNVALLITLAVATYILTKSENPWLYIVTLLLPVFILSPITFRYSRIILLYWLTPGIHFEPKKAEKNYKNPFLEETL